MAKKNIDIKKMDIFKQVIAIESIQMIETIESYVREISSIFAPTKADITVESLKKEQNYQAIDKKEFDELVDELDIREPLEDLLLMLN